MLKQRVYTALLLAPLALAGVFWLPVAGFAVFIGLVIMLGAWEWANLSGFEQQSVRVVYAVLAGVACGFTYFLTPVLVLGVSGLWWLVVYWLVRGYPGSARYCESRVLRLAMGFLTLVPAWYALMQLKQHPQSGFMIALVLLMVWAADCGAYFAGKALGKNKLAENVSPKKTLEGLVGGLVMSVLVSSVVALWFDFSFALGLGLLMLTVLTVLVSVLGDLWESLLKRERGIKDSSQLLPGHGGILDRIDSLTAAVPIFTLAVLVSGS